MMRDIDTIEFENEDGEIVDFYVLEQTMLSGTNYILVTDSNEDEEGECLILKETMMESDDVAIYEIVEDDKELASVSKIFSELLEDIDLEV